MFVPLYELQDVRALRGGELGVRDQYAVERVLQGVSRDGLRRMMQGQGWRFSNAEYTRWREVARSMHAEIYRDLLLTEEEIQELGLG